MDWIKDLLFPGNTSIASTLVLYSFVIAAGVYLGKMKIKGVSLGVTFVLFVGILMGHFGYVVEEHLLKFLREFGLILFIFSIGLQVGPGFFSSFKEGGVRLNVLAVVMILLNVFIALCIHDFGNIKDPSAIVGIMSGAVTNTPGLAAAQQTVSSMGSPEQANLMATAYAASYPLGVVGIIVAMFIIRAIFRINVKDEVKQIEDEHENSQLKPFMISLEVSNKLVDGRTLLQLHDVIACNFVVSRMITTDGTLVIPKSSTEIHIGDKLLIVASMHDADKFYTVLGNEIDINWEKAPTTPVYSRRILITKSEYNGVPLGTLRLHRGYRLNATRVHRAGVDLLATPGLRLQMGDRLTVVGDLEDIDRLATRLGNSMKRLHQPNLITIFVGIIFGIILGSINLGFGMKLGLAGGPLVVAILLSKFGYKFKLVTYTSSSASMMLRELGICLFLASVGISAGKGFAAAVFNTTGMWWVFWGFVITLVPLLIVGCIARGKYKLNYLTIMGLFSGAYTDPPALAYANNSTGNDQAAVAYSTVYPLTMFLRVVAAQIIIMILP